MRAVRPVMLAVVTGPVLILMLMIQPHYFFAKPSFYSLFSAVVADRGVTVERDISYAEHPRLKLDVYTPNNNNDTGQPRPVVLFLYGGTWKEGDRAIYGFVGAALAARGLTTVIPDYRLHPDVLFPAFVEDVARAYTWTRKRFAGTGRTVFIMGHSAGAHMAAMLSLNPAYVRAYDPQSALPDGFIGLAGPYAYDLTTYPTTEDLFHEGQDAAQTIPANFVTKDAPPALLIHGAQDDTVKLKNQKALSDALGKAGVYHETHVPDGLDHVGVIRALAWPFRNSAPVIDLVVKFARQQADRTSE